MTDFARRALLSALVLLVVACAPVTAMPSELAPSEAAESPTSQEFHPLDTQTGMEEIDTILAAVASGDIQMIRSLIGFTSAECTTQEGLGGPPKCREGEAEGTLVEVLSSLGPEGSFTRKDEIESWPGIEVSGLYAIYRVSPAVTYEQYYPAGEFAIVYGGQENRPGIALRVSDGKIVRVDHIFDPAPGALAELVQRESWELILAPIS